MISFEIPLLGTSLNQNFEADSNSSQKRIEVAGDWTVSVDSLAFSVVQQL